MEKSWHSSNVVVWFSVNLPFFRLCSIWKRYNGYGFSIAHSWWIIWISSKKKRLGISNISIPFRSQSRLEMVQNYRKCFAKGKDEFQLFLVNNQFSWISVLVYAELIRIIKYYVRKTRISAWNSVVQKSRGKTIWIIQIFRWAFQWCFAERTHV